MTSYFFAIEQTIRRPSDGGLGYAEGHGTRSHGSLTLLENTSYTDATILASDSGYRTQPTDPGGPIPYPPRVQEAFSVDALVNLDPAQSAVGASWGNIQLANNDGYYDGIINGGWISDGRDTHILYGTKNLENFVDQATARSTQATWLDQNNTLQLAAAAVLRQDFTGAIALDPTATNVVRNSSAVGAVVGTVGSGGVMPNGWGVNAPGLAVEISTYRSGLVGTGTVVRLRFHGTATSTSGSLNYGTTGSMSGLPVNQPIVQSHYMSRVAGAFTNVTQIVHWVAVYDATAVATVAPQPNFMPSITATLTRFSRTYSTPATGNAPWATSNPSIVFYWPTGAAIDFTIDFAAPQLERGTDPTAVIPTSTGDVTRGDGATNYAWPSDMTGAVAGTPGTLPTGWTVNLSSGISQQVVAIGTDATTGYKYMDLRLFGTSPATLTVVNIGASTNIDANTGQAWCPSVYASIVAGAQTGMSFSVGIQELDSTGSTLLGSDGEAFGPLNTNIISRSRRNFPAVTQQATTRYVVLALRVSYAANTAIDVTIRLMAPQCEGGGLASSFIPTASAPAFRAATYSITGTPVLLNEIAKNQYVLSTQTPSTANTTVAASTNVPAIYSGVPVWKHLRTATGADTNFGTIGVGGLPSTGAALRASIWVWLPSSLSSAKTAVTIGLEGNVTAPTSVAANRALVDQWQRITASATLTSGFATTNIVLRISPQLAGDVIYTSAWQLELNSVTSFIPPTAAITLRAADALYTARNILLDPPYASLIPAFNGVAGSISSDDQQLTIPLRDASYWLERPVLRTTYGGNGQYDGTTALTGSLKPLVIGGSASGASWYGAVNNITPILVDPPMLIYQVSDGAIGRLSNLYEGGHAGGWAFAGDVPDLYVGSTPAGSYRTSLARGCFQLGSTPTYAISVDVNGPPLTGSPPSTALNVAAYALTTLCGVPASLVALNGTALALVGAATPVASGCALFLAPGDTPAGLDLITRILAPAGMKLVACRDGKLRAFVIAALPAKPTVKTAIDNRMIISITPIALPAGISPTPYRMRVGYNDNYTQQTTDLSPLIDATRKQYLATPQSIAQSNSSVLYSSITRPNDPAVITGSVVDAAGGLTALAAAQAAANQYTALWGVRRRVYGIGVPFTVGIGLEYGDVVSITTEIGDLSGTKLGQVVGYNYRSEDASIALRILV